MVDFDEEEVEIIPDNCADLSDMIELLIDNLSSLDKRTNNYKLTVLKANTLIDIYNKKVKFKCYNRL